MKQRILEHTRRFIRLFSRVVLFFTLLYGIQAYFEGSLKSRFGFVYCATLSLILFWTGRSLKKGGANASLQAAFWGTLLSASIHAIPPVSYVTLGLIPVISALIFLTYPAHESLKRCLLYSWSVTAFCFGGSFLLPQSPATALSLAADWSSILVATALILTLIWQHDAMQKMRRAEHAELEQKFFQSQKMEAVGRLAGGVAHDFNNLLTVILGYANFLVDDMGADDPRRQDITEISRAGKRAADLTKDLLAFSRQQVMELKTVDLNLVILGMDNMARRLVGEDIELITRPSASLASVRVDTGRMEQVLMNLVVNAKDAMPNGGKLTIETGMAKLDGDYALAHADVVPGDYVMMAVSDTGAGMDKATLSRIFEPFFTTKPKGKGTGLGLSTVFGIMRQSGGHVWVYSEPGKGTTFKLYFPSTSEPAEALEESSSALSHAKADATILVVEDEEQLGKLMRRILEGAGYTVLSAASGPEALKVSEQYKEPIHLLLTDVIMPQMSGKQLAEQLQPVRRDMKVLYVSGYTDNSIVHHGILDTGVAFLQKPFSFDMLTKKVRETLG